MRAQLARLVWTTNFDPLVADACAKVYDGTGSLTTVALDAPDVAAQCIANGRWPIEIKLHGDFRSRRLKNTGDELRQQDARLRRVFVYFFRPAGLFLCRDSWWGDSLIEAFSGGLGHSTPLSPRVVSLHRGVDTP